MRTIGRLTEAFTLRASFWTALHLGLIAPGIALAHVRAWRVQRLVRPRFERFASAPSLRTFLPLLFFHPYLSFRYVIPETRISWTKEKRAVEPRESTETHEDGAGGGIEASEPFGNEQLLKMLNDAEISYLDRQVVSVAIREGDSRLFGGHDRDFDGFVRLMLRESYHHFVLPGSEVEHYIVFEPRLLLHESGVIQLDLALTVDSGLDTRQLLALMWGPEEIFTRSRMATPLLAGTEWSMKGNTTGAELDAGKPLVELEHETRVSMSELLHVHLQAILEAINGRASQWVNYPVALAEAVDCCPPERWKKNHREDLLRLIMRSRHNSGIHGHVAEPIDLSYDNRRSLFAELGSALLLQWRGRIQGGIEELDTVLVVEYALLIYMRLLRLEDSVARAVTRQRTLHSLNAAAIRLFSDLRQRELRAGESREIVRYLLDRLGAQDMRQTIETALSMSASAYSTRSAERASHRSWWITFAATAVGFGVAHRPLADLLAALPPATEGESMLLSGLRWIADTGFWGPWLLLSGLVALIAILRSAGLAWRLSQIRWPSINRGFKWPNEFVAETRPFSPLAGERATRYRVDLDLDTENSS